jgi:hypothetical protein
VIALSDPIRCAVDASQAHHTIDCEPVVIGPEAPEAPAPAPAPAPEPAPSRPAEAPPLPAAVRALVQRAAPPQEQEHAVQGAAVDTLTLGGAMQCLAQINAMTLLLLGVKGPVLGAAAAFKVGYDVGACIAKDKNTRQLSVDQAAALADCVDKGGTPQGEIGHTLVCERAAPPSEPAPRS